MQILVGTVTTQPALSVFPMTNDDRVFTITPSASGDDCIEGNDTVFQVCFTDSNQGTRSAQYIDENFSGRQDRHHLQERRAVLHRHPRQLRGRGREPGHGDRL